MESTTSSDLLRATEAFICPALALITLYAVLGPTSIVFQALAYMTGVACFTWRIGAGASDNLTRSGSAPLDSTPHQGPPTR